MLKKVATAAFLASISLGAQADFIEADWESTGDNLAVLDTETGVEWLDLTVTEYTQYQNVVNELDTTYTGWRLPTISEVDSMFSRFFQGLADSPTGSVDHASGTAGATLANEWHSLFNSQSLGYPVNYGMFDRNGTVHLAGAIDIGSGSYRTIAPNWTPDYDYSSDAFFQTGTFLVRNTDGGTSDPVTEPEQPVADVFAPGAIGALSLFGLLGLRRRTR